MAFVHKENTGSLFDNERKEMDTHPDFTGSAMIGGVEYWISAWNNQGREKEYISLRFSPKENATAQSPVRSRRPEKAPAGYEELSSAAAEKTKEALARIRAGRAARDIDEDDIPF